MMTRPELPEDAHAAPHLGSDREEFRRRLTRCVKGCAAGRRGILVRLEVAGAWDVKDAGGSDALEALRDTVAATLAERLDESVCCLAGGLCGFTLLLEDWLPGRALDEIRRIKHAVDHLCFHWHGHPFRLAAYAGVLELGPDEARPRQWLARAQDACTAARELAGDGLQVVAYDDRAWNDIARKREWVRHLSEIIG